MINHHPQTQLHNTLTTHHNVQPLPEPLSSEVSGSEKSIKGKKSTLSKIGSAVGKVCACPFRTASTLFNGALFAGYYVTTMTATGIAAAGGTVYGVAQIAKSRLCGETPKKTLAQYAITPANKTFNFIGRLYHSLPDGAAEFFFAGIPVVALYIVFTIFSNGNPPAPSRPRNKPEERYTDPIFLSPYKLATDFAAKMMDVPKSFLGGGSESQLESVGSKKTSYPVQ